MARSGAFSTSQYSGRCVDFNWWIIEQSTAGNYTKIGWNIAGGGGASGYYKAAPFTVVIDGEQVYYSDTRIELYFRTIITSGEKIIYHNADGTRSFSVSVSAAIYSYAVNCSGSGSWTIDSIPRGASITAAPNFNDEGNPTITYSNPAGNNAATLEACITWEGAGNNHIPYRDISKSGTSYTFNLTEEERVLLRNAAKNSNTLTVKFVIYTRAFNNDFWSNVEKTLTIVNATPTFTSSVKDMGGASTALTGATAGNVSMIKGFNYMSCSMVATAYKGASITKYKITNGANVVEAAAANFNNSEHNSFKFEVWDSRGNHNSYTTTVPMINYIPLTVNTDGKILLSTADNTKASIALDIKGNCFNGNFGVQDNTLALDYTVVDTDGNEITRGSIDTASFSGNTYTAQYAIDDLDYRLSYIVYVGASDKIGAAQAYTKTLQAIPLFDWGEHDFNFNIPVTIQGKDVMTEINTINSRDYIVEQGASGIWTWRKWNSGLAELWGAYGFNNGVNCNVAWGSMYESAALQLPDFPFNFTGVPHAHYTWRVDSGSAYSGAAWVEWAAPTKSGAGYTYICRPTPITIYGYICMYFKGNWK